MKKLRFVRLIGIALLALLAIGLFGLIVMWLWNALLPPLFGWKLIGFWQAMGLLVLARILFGGFGRGGHRHWRSRMRERCARMTPEEREKFRAAMMERLGKREEPAP
jgi:hypothetical protein